MRTLVSLHITLGTLYARVLATSIVLSHACIFTSRMCTCQGVVTRVKTKAVLRELDTPTSSASSTALTVRFGGRQTP